MIAISGDSAEGPFFSIIWSFCLLCNSAIDTAKRLGVEKALTIAEEILTFLSSSIMLFLRDSESFDKSFGGSSSVPNSNKKSCVFMLNILT